MMAAVQAFLKDWPDFAKFSLLVCFAALILKTFMGPLTDLLTPFCAGPLFFAVLAGSLLLILVSMPYILFSWQTQKQKSALPLLINTVTLTMLWFVWPDQLWMDFRFWLNRHEYQEVVQLVEEGRLASAEGVVALPAEYHHLTAGGDEVVIDRNDGVIRIYFFAYRGLVYTGSTGYVYRSDGLPCQNGDFGNRWVRVEPKRPNWFYCASDG